MKLTAAVRELRTALDTFNVSRNALSFEAFFGDDVFGEPAATVTHPSAFTSDVKFVGLLAHFVQAGMPIRLELVQYSSDGEDLLQQCCLYPGLDDGGLAVLGAVDPLRAEDHASAQTQATRALQGLRTEAEHHGFTFASPGSSYTGSGPEG
jgi:hypothetical protein